MSLITGPKTSDGWIVLRGLCNDREVASSDPQHASFQLLSLAVEKVKKPAKARTVFQWGLGGLDQLEALPQFISQRGLVSDHTTKKVQRFRRELAA